MQQGLPSVDRRHNCARIIVPLNFCACISDHMPLFFCPTLFRHDVEDAVSSRSAGSGRSWRGHEGVAGPRLACIDCGQDRKERSIAIEQISSWSPRHHTHLSYS